MESPPLHYCMLVVDETPYCVWDWDMQGRTVSFLEGVDPDYFVYLAEIQALQDFPDNESWSTASERLGRVLPVFWPNRS